MLPVALRLRSSDEIRATIRHGVSVGRGGVVVHGRLRDDDGSARVGLAVSKAVGSAVVRNTVRRRMRGVVIEQRALLPIGTDFVLRARPSAAGRVYSDLREDIRGAVSDVSRRLVGRSGTRR